ncbi:MAG: hypothetical protein E7420_00640 [Ruminococcaceae bacterium]|nr:hypothetical protein [Oscillospiraceae bacterium]
MSFWYAAFWGLAWAWMMFYVGTVWSSILNLKITFSALLISALIVCVAATIFMFYASDRTLTIGFIIGVSLIVLSWVAEKIYFMIKKSKNS